MLSKLFKIIKKYERICSALGLVSGIVLTPLALTRVDQPIENVWIVAHLLIAIFGIMVLNYHDNRVAKGRSAEKHNEIIHFWFSILIQFAYGNLFTTYIVFYFRSAVLSFAWPFLLLIFTLLIGNEIWKKHYHILTLQLATLFLAVYMFVIFGLPVLLKRIGDDVFLWSGVYSLLFIFIFALVLWSFTKEKFKKSKKGLIFSILGTYLIMNGMYFLNIIPPIPLSLKTAGVYHDLSKNSDGDYVGHEENYDWKKYFVKYPIFHRVDGEPVYVFGAVFSPAKLNTKIYHKWQYFDEGEKKWEDSMLLEISIVGGREGGYRIYSSKEAVFPGLWRVDVLNVNKQIIGRLKFKIENSELKQKMVEVKL
ncbi:MAG: DUF2914 domain-containing protein [Candidatus Paceibacterota bacterium]|jgi:hypothetical protein